MHPLIANLSQKVCDSKSYPELNEQGWVDFDAPGSPDTRSNGTAREIRRENYLAKILSGKQEELSAVRDGRNDALNRAAYYLAGAQVDGDFAFTESQIGASLRNASKSNGYTEKVGWSKVDGIIECAISAGRAKPHDLPFRDDHQPRRLRRSQSTAAPVAKQPEVIRLEVDLGDGKRLDSTKQIEDQAAKNGASQPAVTASKDKVKVEWICTDLQGSTAVHTRWDDQGTGEKVFSWPQGTKAKQMIYPAYDWKQQAAEIEVLVIGEGEKTADAIHACCQQRDKHYGVWGTVGSGIVPNDGVLTRLVAMHPRATRLILCPDSDDAGTNHTEKLAAKLKAISEAANRSIEIMVAPCVEADFSGADLADVDDLDLRFDYLARATQWVKISKRKHLNPLSSDNVPGVAREGHRV